MKSKKSDNESSVAAILQDLVDRHVASQPQQTKSSSSIVPAPSQAPSLYQDAGGGYNSNFVFPQK